MPEIGDTRPAPPEPEPMAPASPAFVVVDGSNLATEGRSTPSLAQLDDAVRGYVAEHPDAHIVVVVDATFAHRIDPSERAELDEAELHGEVISPPAGTVGRGDAFVLRIAERADATVLSNDSFQEFHGEHPWLFEPGRLVGGKPVPGIGWIFTERNPVRGPKSRAAVQTARRPVRQRGTRGRNGAAARDGTNVDQLHLEMDPVLGAVVAEVQAEIVDPERTPGAVPADGPVLQPAAAENAVTKKVAAKKTAATKKVAAKKTAAKKAPAATKKAPAKKAAATEKATTEKAAAKKTTAKKAPAKKAPAKKAPAKKAPAKKAAATEQATTEKAAAKKTTAKKAPAKRATAAKKAPATVAPEAPAEPGPAPGADGRPPSAPLPPVGTPTPRNDPLPFIAFAAEHPIGSTVAGTVVGFASHGALVDVELGAHGVLHCYVPLSGLADPPPRRAREVVERGETRAFNVVGLDTARRTADLEVVDEV